MILNINGAVQAIGLALLVLFFLVGMARTSASLDEVKRPEHALKLFIRFAIAKGVVTYGLELMMAIFTIIQGVVSTIMRSSGIAAAGKMTLPKEMVKAIKDCGFFDSILLWAVTLIGSLVITVLSFIIILPLYVFNEQYNGDEKTDYVSALRKVTIGQPGRVSILTPKAGRKKVTVRWKEVSGSFRHQVGYQLKGKKTWKYLTSKTTYKTVKKLKSRKYYNVKVRAYKKVGTTTCYGKWSDVKRVKIK